MTSRKKTRGNREDRAIEIYDGEVIEGGEISELDVPYKVDPLKKQRAATTRSLAYILVGILALSVVLHYITIAWLLINEKKELTVELSTIFSTWLPVISGLAGSAVTYYFAQEK
ncbi:MAG: hypothetical protein JNM55_07695 [Anaerolineales bacterium]|nr:hypothetical protein [Anaerolineales bacterium]